MNSGEARYSRTFTTHGSDLEFVPVTFGFAGSLSALAKIARSLETTSRRCNARPPRNYCVTVTLAELEVIVLPLLI